MKQNNAAVLNALRAESENKELSADGWADIYLDNAKALLPNISQQSFRACLATLSKRGYYKPFEGYAWGRGRVRL